MLGPARPSRPLEQFFFLTIVSDIERSYIQLTYAIHDMYILVTEAYNLLKPTHLFHALL